MGDEEWLDLGPGQDEAAEGPLRHDVGNRWLAEKNRDLAEEVAPGERRPLGAVDDDRRLAFEDHVKGGSRQPLAENPLAFGIPALLERVGDTLELRCLEVGEQGEG